MILEEAESATARGAPIYAELGGEGEIAIIEDQLYVSFFDDDGVLHHVGVTSSFKWDRREELAAELAPQGIRVNAIAPGTVDTDMVRNNPPEARAVMAKAALLGRAAHPDELVGLALYLASDASSFVTGQTIAVDGGWVSV